MHGFHLQGPYMYHCGVQVFTRECAAEALSVEIKENAT